MDVLTHDFKDNPQEKDAAILFRNMDLSCVALNYKLKNSQNEDEGEIDGLFSDNDNQFYILYDISSQSVNRQDKISKFLNKWKDHNNQTKLRKALNLRNWHIYVIYVDRSGKADRLASLNYLLDDFTKVIYTDDYTYFERLFQNVGKWVKNDFLNFLNIKPAQLIRKQITATQIYVGDVPALVFADKVEQILKYGYISRRRDNSEGYQRMVDKKRVDKIASLIKANQINPFPNSILLNCANGLGFHIQPKSHCPCQVQFDLPNSFSSCKIVDGQHRLLAFSKLEPTIQDSHSLPIVLFEKMSTEVEIRTFIEINDSQKGIDPNLIYSLKGDLDFPNGTKENKEKIAVMIARRLNESTGLFKGNVFFGNASEERKKKITLTTIVQSLLNFKIIDTIDSPFQNSEDDFETPCLKIEEFIKALLSRESANIPFFKSNIGIQLILKFISLLERNKQKQNVVATIEEASVLFNDSITRNKESIPGKYGKAGFNKLSTLILNDIKKQKGLGNFVIELKNFK